MRTMKLSLDDLHVDSFATVDHPGSARGTVFGNADVPGGEVGLVRTRGCLDTNRDCQTHISCYSHCAYDCYSFESCPGTCPMQGTCHDTCDFRRCVAVVEPVPVEPEPM